MFLQWGRGGPFASSWQVLTLQGGLAFPSAPSCLPELCPRSCASVYAGTASTPGELCLCPMPPAPAGPVQSGRLVKERRMEAGPEGQSRLVPQGARSLHTHALTSAARRAGVLPHLLDEKTEVQIQQHREAEGRELRDALRAPAVPLSWEPRMGL